MQKDIIRRHITDEMWIALKQDTIRPEEYMEILAHTCDCTWCAERLANALEQEEQSAKVLPPSYLAGEILERAKQLDVVTVQAVKRTSKKLQLFLYSMKVGVAVAFSMLILVLLPITQQSGFEHPIEQHTRQSGYGDFLEQEEQPGYDEPIKQHTREESFWIESGLDWMNRAANGVTERMNDFADLLLNGGK